MVGVLVAMSACNRPCPQLYCAGFPDRYDAMMPGKSGDVIRFTNGVDTIVTTLNSLKNGASVHPLADRGGVCTVPGRCRAAAYWTVESPQAPDTSRLYVSLYFTADSAKPADDDIMLQFSQGGGGSVSLQPQLGDEKYDLILPTLQLGGKHYTRVIARSSDTLEPYYRKERYWRIYLTNPGGFIGFEDRKTRTTFWRL